MTLRFELSASFMRFDGKPSTKNGASVLLFQIVYITNFVAIENYFTLSTSKSFKITHKKATFEVVICPVEIRCS